MSKSHKPTQRSVALVVGGMSTVLAMPVVANEAVGLEEIVVTARKREENLQHYWENRERINEARRQRYRRSVEVAGTQAGLS